MSQPIHMLYLIKRKEAWYQLADEKKNEITRQTLQATLRAGGKRLIIYDSRFGVAADLSRRPASRIIAWSD